MFDIKCVFIVFILKERKYDQLTKEVFDGFH